MSAQPPPFTFESIVALWNAGKGPKEIAREIGKPAHSVNGFISNARTLFGETLFPRYHRNAMPSTNRRKGGSLHWSSKPAAFWQEVARLWNEGKSGPQIAFALEGVQSPTRGVSLVSIARYHLGLTVVPKRPLGKAPKTPVTPITMAEFCRHYLRKVGDEYIFRTEEGKEEVWIETTEPTGLVFRSRGHKAPRRLTFKANLGIG